MRYHLNFRDLDERTRYASLFHREACKLQKHLVDYKPDLIDVWGFMASLPRNAGYAARMRVHLPTGTLKAEGRGFTRFSAWTDVSAEMGVRIERHKARLPGSRSRHRKEHHERRWETLRRRPDPDVDSTVASSIQVGYPDLLEFLRTEVRLHEERGNLPKRFADPMELVGEVVVEVLQNEHRKPQDIKNEHWFLKVAYERVLSSIDQARQIRSRNHLGTSLHTILPRREGPEGLVEEEDLVDELIGSRQRLRFGHDIPDPRSLP